MCSFYLTRYFKLRCVKLNLKEKIQLCYKHIIKVSAMSITLSFTLFNLQLYIISKYLNDCCKYFSLSGVEF